MRASYLFGIRSIPKLLAPEEFVNEPPDERSVLLYLAVCFDHISS